MRKIGSYIVCLFFLSAVSIRSYSQEDAVIKASVDKDHILIGEPIRLMFDITTSGEDSIQWPAVDSIPHFEFISKTGIDSARSADGYVYHTVWTITSFDSGAYAIPAFSFVAGKKTYTTDSLSIQVSYSSIDSLKDYHDIKDIIEVANPSVKWIIWIVAGITLLSIIAFVYLARRPIKNDEEEKITEKERLTAYEEALAALEALKKMPLNDAAAVKSYYTKMNDILRLFVMRKLQISSLERTNEELILSLSKLPMEREKFSQLANSLRMSDFVKFAKYVPDRYDNEKNLETIKSSIVLLNETGK